MLCARFQNIARPDAGVEYGVGGWLAVQTDGRVLVAGDSAVDRLNSNGGLDSSFANGQPLGFRAAGLMFGERKQAPRV